MQSSRAATFNFAESKPKLLAIISVVVVGVLACTCYIATYWSRLYDLPYSASPGKSYHIHFPRNRGHHRL